MATGGAYSRSVLGGSEPFYDFPCTPCADEGRNVEATNFTSSYYKYQYKQCYAWLCQGVDYIPIVANGFKSSSELRDVKKSMQQVRKDLESFETIRNINLKAIQKDKDTCLADIDSFRDSIVQYLDSLVKKAKDEVCDKATTLKSGINTSIQKLHDMISQLDVSIGKLETCKPDNEPQLFLYVKQGNSKQNQGRQLLREVGTPTGREILKFDIDTSIEDYFRSLMSIGEAKTTRFSDEVSSARLEGNFKISDNAKCTGSCLLDDGSLLLTDCNNYKLLKLDKKYSIVKTCDLDNPCGVCKTGPNGIAVALIIQSCIQLLSTSNGKLKGKSLFKMDNRVCKYVAYSNGELFVSCGEGVSVYNLSGKQLRQFKTDSAGRKIIYDLKQLGICQDGTHVYVADRKHGVHVFDRKGNHQTTITSPDLKNAFGLCVLENNTVLVSCCETRSILLINCSTRKSKLLLSKADLVDEPRALCYDNTTGRLIITFNDKDHIQVYILLRKYMF